MPDATPEGLVRAGGHPYILITVVDPETGGVNVENLGIADDVVPVALRQIADLLESSDA